jgi:hypothetical protein
VGARGKGRPGGGGRDVLITGVPRGGTTLTVQLLSGLSDCVAVDEPISLAEFVNGAERRTGPLRSFFGRRRPASATSLDRERIADNVMQFCSQARDSLLSDGTVISKHVEGAVSGGRVSDVVDSDGKRVRFEQRGSIRIDKPLSSEFTLYVKQNSRFAAILPELTARAPVFAVVRNPLAILASWNTVAFAVSRGHAGWPERFDPKLKTELAARPDVLDRQLYLLDWFFQQIRRYLPTNQVVRYEDIVASKGTALSVVHPAASSLHVELTSRNQASIYKSDLMGTLCDRILSTDGSYWSFYESQDVKNLISEQGSAG